MNIPYLPNKWSNMISMIHGNGMINILTYNKQISITQNIRLYNKNSNMIFMVNRNNRTLKFPQPYHIFAQNILSCIILLKF